MSPVPMRKLELHVLKRDMDLVLELIGKSRCFQLSTPRSSEKASRPASPELERLHEIRDRLDLKTPETMPDGAHLPGPAEEALLTELVEKTRALVEAEKRNEERRNRVKETLGEARAFSGLSLPFKELDHLSFLAVRIGRVAPTEIEGLRSKLGERALVLPLDDEGNLVAAASKKGRFALDTELQRAAFSPKEVPPDFKGLPPELEAGLEAELASLEAEAEGLAKKKAELRAVVAKPWEALSASYALAEAIEEVKSGLESSELVYRLEGWVPKDRLLPLTTEIRRLTQGRSALRSYAPEELPSVRSGEEKVPVLLKRRPFVSSFERLVISYGAPLYGTVDPTPLVAFSFVLLFSVMFGDLGQGAVILLAGLLLRREVFPTLKKWKIFGPILVAVGLGSMIMGFLEGSVFTNEELLVPFTRALSGALFGQPRDRFLSLMPQGGMAKLFAFFGFTLALGVVINSVGLVVNIINKIRLRRLGEALFSKTGLAGALFFWWAIGLALRVLLGGKAAWFDLIGFLLPLLAIFFEDPLGRLVEGRPAPKEGEGGLGFFIKGLVEIIESVSTYFSNTLSFLRVGAFALAHTVLSFIVFTMGELLRTRAPAGFLWEFLVLVLGNAIILVLEGMIVTIQVVRLQYYEFFSKFFTETGVEFVPFRFEYPKE